MTDYQETAYIIHPEIKPRPEIREISSVIEEAEGLARAIHLDVIETKIVNLSKIQPGTLLGKGQTQDIATQLSRLKPDVVIMNHTLSPIQQRNLERKWDVKVIDRTGLILEIFGERAQTKEGRLQVDLAALDYQRSRLVRSWTHLERQRGGAGFMGGPGEMQIEIDRRLIDQRITKLKKELERVRRTRELGRQSRERVPFPVIALVGYTNAGKSTLFNYLTEAGVFAEDLPFATLDPTMRRIALPGEGQAILSDTVGFISDLPTHLVEAFRATLEQISYADVTVHVIDASNPDYEAQRKDVIQILEGLGIGYENDERTIELYNKIDAVDPEDLSDFARKIKVSALSGEGIEQFLDKAATIIAKQHVQACFAIKPSDGKALAWLYENGEILKREDQETQITIHVMMDPAKLGQFTEHYPYKPQLKARDS